MLCSPCSIVTHQTELLPTQQQARVLKDIVKERFMPQFIYRENVSESKDSIFSKKQSKGKTSTPSFLEMNSACHSYIKPTILQKNSLLPRKININQFSKLRKSIRAVKDSSELITKRIRYTHIPLWPNENSTKRQQRRTEISTRQSSFPKRLSNSSYFFN